MAAPEILSITNWPAMPDVDAVTEATWEVIPDAGAKTLAAVHLSGATGNDTTWAPHTYGGVVLGSTGVGAVSGHAWNTLWHMEDISLRGSDVRSLTRKWDDHYGWDILLGGSDVSIVDSARHIFTDWDYTGMNPLVLDPAGKDCIAIVAASIDSVEVGKIYTPVASNGATATLQGTQGIRPGGKWWTIPVLASDGEVSIVVTVSGEACLSGLLVGASAAASRKRNQAIVVM